MRYRLFVDLSPIIDSYVYAVPIKYGVAYIYYKEREEWRKLNYNYITKKYDKINVNRWKKSFNYCLELTQSASIKFLKLHPIVENK